LTFGLQHPPLQHANPVQLINPQHLAFGTVGPESFGADNFGALSFGGEILGGLIFGLQQELHAIPEQPAQLINPQHLAFGIAGPSIFGAVNLGADNFGALSFGGLIDGAFNFGLQQEPHPAPQHAHESLRFYQHPTFLAIFGPSSFGADIFGAFIFGADIFGAFILGAGAKAAFNLFAPFGSILPAAGINIAWVKS